MPRGPSGRVVVEIDPQLKQDLYVELARNGTTLKSWFVTEVSRFVAAQSCRSDLGAPADEADAQL